MSKLLIHYVNIGYLPRKKAEEIILECKQKFINNGVMDLLGDKNRIVFVPVRERETEIQVIDLD